MFEKYQTYNQKIGFKGTLEGDIGGQDGHLGGKSGHVRKRDPSDRMKRTELTALEKLKIIMMGTQLLTRILC